MWKRVAFLLCFLATLVAASDEGNVIDIGPLGETTETTETTENGRRAGRRLIRRMKRQRGGMRTSGSFALNARAGFQGNHEEEEAFEDDVQDLGEGSQIEAPRSALGFVSNKPDGRRLGEGQGAGKTPWWLNVEGPKHLIGGAATALCLGWKQQRRCGDDFVKKHCGMICAAAEPVRGRCYFSSPKCTTGAICSHEPTKQAGAGKPYDFVECAGHGLRHNCKWRRGACVAQPPWDLDFERLPKARLCRASMDFYGSLSHAMLCRNILKTNDALKNTKRWKGEEWPILKLYPDLDICPTAGPKQNAKEDWQVKMYKHKFYELPTLKQDSSYDEYSKKYPELLKYQKHTTSEFLGMSQILCLGRCAVPPVFKNGFMVEDSYCKCHDGAQMPLYAVMNDRWKQWDVLNVFTISMLRFHTSLCGSVPAVGCKWCDVGFSPFDPKSWYSERLPGSIVRKRHLTKTYVESKINAFPVCPKWWTQADGQNKAGFVTTKGWLGGKNPKNRSKAQRKEDAEYPGYATNDKEPCPRENEVQGMPKWTKEQLLTLPSKYNFKLKGGRRLLGRGRVGKVLKRSVKPGQEEDLDLDLGQGVKQHAGVGVWRRRRRRRRSIFRALKKTIEKATKKTKKAAKAAKKKAKGLTPVAQLIKLVQGLVQKIVPHLPCLTGRNKKRITWVVNKVVENYARNKGGVADTLKMYVLGWCGDKYCSDIGINIPGPDTGPYAPIAQNLVPNLLVCLGSAYAAMRAFTRVNQFIEPAMQVQQLCSKLDQLSPFTGLPRLVPLPGNSGTFHNGIVKSVLRYPEETTLTLPLGEGQTFHNGGIILFPHIDGHEVPPGRDCSRQKPCSPSEAQSVEKDFMEKNNIKLKDTHINYAMSGTWTIHSVRADRLWMRAFVMNVDYKNKYTSFQKYTSERPKYLTMCSNAVRKVTGITPEETNFDDIRNKYKILDGNVERVLRNDFGKDKAITDALLKRLPTEMKKTFESLPKNGTKTETVCKHSEMPYMSQLNKFRYAFSECVHPLCESAVGHHNVLWEEIGPNQFILVDCRKRKVVRKTVGGASMDYVVVDGGKVEYPLLLHDRVEVCSSQTTPWSRPMGLKMAKPSCMAEAKLRLDVCNTCCCAKGNVATSMSQSLIVGGQKECGSWLSMLDWGLRTFLSGMRIIALVDKVGKRCFNEIDTDNPNRRDGYDGKSIRLKYGQGQNPKTHVTVQTNENQRGLSAKDIQGALIAAGKKGHATTRPVARI